MSVNCDTIRNVIDTALTAQQETNAIKTLFMDYPNYYTIIVYDSAIQGYKKSLKE